MPDHEVHEIQLNGKQLVFMFMAATVVSVVIFLCGVMVGRGVREPQVELLAASAESTVDPTAPRNTAAPRLAPSADSAAATAPESLTYAEHLEAPVAPNEPLKPAARKPVAAPAVAEPAPAKPAVSKAVPPQDAVRPTSAPQKPPATKSEPTTPEKAPVAKPEPAIPPKALAAKPDPPIGKAGFTEPAGGGFVVQVMAFPTRPDAEALASRLTAKGYRTFVTLNDAAPRARYRVRIGKYATRPEAVAVANKLQQEERFEPWVTR